MQTVWLLAWLACATRLCPIRNTAVANPQHPCPQHCSAIKGKIATKQDKIPVDATLIVAYIELIERHNVFDQPVIKGITR